MGGGMRPNQSDCRISNLDQSEGCILYHVTWPHRNVILRSGTKFRDWVQECSPNMGARLGPEMTSSNRNKRQTIKFSKNTLLFKPDLTIVRRWPCLRHSFLSRSHRDTIRKCRDRRRVCRRRLCIASFLRRPARSWCSRPI